jgi:hypothetical protein
MREKKPDIFENDVEKKPDIVLGEERIIKNLPKDN